MTKEEDEVQEALVRQGKIFLLENEIVTSDAIINDLIMFGFVAHKSVQDVEVFIDEDKKQIIYVLFFNWFFYQVVSIEKLQDKLQAIVQSGLTEYTIKVKIKRYGKENIVK